MNLALPDPALIANNVKIALAEDIGSGDITAQLISAEQQAKASVITREHAVLAGQAWVNEAFKQVDLNLQINWFVSDGEPIKPDQLLFEVTGAARSILTAERGALNFLQLLSGTARTAAEYASKVKHTDVTLLDTRKTIPGLRVAQKYAVTCGGCKNHRIGLYDAFLIKENHIEACGSISAAILRAKAIAADKKVEIEVESQDELEQALVAGADIIMLDNFSLNDSAAAVKFVNGKAKLEASGNITDETLVSVAETGVDFISIGALTKHCSAVDLSMRLTSI